MKKLLPLPPLLLLILLAGCQKWETGHVRERAAGYVIEYGTGRPIPDAFVSLGACDSDPNGNLNCTTADTTRSAGDGHYSFEIIDNEAVLRVNATKEGYFTDHTTAKSVLDGSEENTDIVLPPYAWLEVTVRNESGANFEIIPPDADGSTEQGIILAQGMDSTLSTFLLRGNQNYKYLFSIRQGGVPLQDINGINVYYEDGMLLGKPTFENSLSPWFPVYCPGHDTTKITITY